MVSKNLCIRQLSIRSRKISQFSNDLRSRCTLVYHWNLGFSAFISRPLDMHRACVATCPRSQWSSVYSIQHTIHYTTYKVWCMLIAVVKFVVELTKLCHSICYCVRACGNKILFQGHIQIHFSVKMLRLHVVWREWDDLDVAMQDILETHFLNDWLLWFIVHAFDIILFVPTKHINTHRHSTTHSDRKKK